MYYTKFYKYLSEFLTTNEVPFEAFAKMVVKYDDDRNRVLKAPSTDVRSEDDTSNSRSLWRFLTKFA